MCSIDTYIITTVFIFIMYFRGESQDWIRVRSGKTFSLVSIKRMTEDLVQVYNETISLHHELFLLS